MDFSRVFKLVPDKSKTSLIYVFILMLLAMVLETFSIGLVIPAISFITQPEAFSDSDIYSRIFEFLNYPDQMTLVIYGMLALVVTYFIKTVFLSYFLWKQNQFCFSMLVELSEEMFRGYLKMPWAFHIENNSAFLLRNVTTEVNTAINNVLLPCLKLASESLVVIGITLLLIIIEPLGTISVISSLFLLGLIFQRFSTTKVSSWGNLRQLHEGKRILKLQESFSAVKEIKLLGREDGFTSSYNYHNLLSARAIQLKLFFQQLPRLFLEFLAISGLTILVLVLVLQGKSPNTYLPIIGLFSAAVFRLMPSVNRIIESLQHLHFGKPSLDVLFNQLSLVRSFTVHESGVTSLEMGAGVKIDNVSFNYPNSDKKILNSISMEIPTGKKIGLIGKSGEGKSTFVDLLLGLLSPTQGEILINGHDINDNLDGWYKNMGYVPQHISLLDDTLFNNIAFGLNQNEIDHDRIQNAIHAAQLNELIESLPNKLDTIIGEKGVKLSGGQRQRIGIARALYLEPKLLVLDEATSALDTNTETQVMDAIFNLDDRVTILIISHRISTVERCDLLYRIENGNVIQEFFNMSTSAQ